MSEAEQDDDQPCPACGQLRTMEMAEDPTTYDYNGPKGTMRAELPTRWVCDNPDCETNASDLAPAADPIEGARLHQSVEGEGPTG